MATRAAGSPVVPPSRSAPWASSRGGTPVAPARGSPWFPVAGSPAPQRAGRSLPLPCSPEAPRPGSPVALRGQLPRGRPPRALPLPTVPGYHVHRWSEGRGVVGRPAVEIERTISPPICSPMAFYSRVRNGRRSSSGLKVRSGWCWAFCKLWGVNSPAASLPGSGVRIERVTIYCRPVTKDAASPTWKPPLPSISKTLATRNESTSLASCILELKRMGEGGGSIPSAHVIHPLPECILTTHFL